MKVRLRRPTVMLCKHLLHSFNVAREADIRLAVSKDQEIVHLTILKIGGSSKRCVTQRHSPLTCRLARLPHTPHCLVTPVGPCPRLDAWVKDDFIACPFCCLFNHELIKREN